MDQILPLSTFQRLPVAVERQGKQLAEPRREAGSHLQPLETPREADEPIAPYQALPVSGATITHNITTALPVIEQGELSQEELEARVNKVVEDYIEKLEHRTEHHMGYPYNLDFDYGPLEGLQRFCINNLGDPFIESNYGVHSREFEIGVLQWFARLWEIELDEFWGYITNCGTEGNLHGILVGREVLPDGILYASCESHYSVFKAARMYRMDAVEVDTLESGEIDYEELRRHLVANAGRPAILNVNIGTTVKGAVDDIDRVLAVLAESGYSEERFFIHCDGALFGMMIPFVKRAPMVTFRKPIGSISVSGHKFVGAPVPCGVVMTRLRHIQGLSSEVEYLNSRDATIMGSRNGHAPIYMWYTFTRKARRWGGMLESAGVKTMLNELSSTVVFERPEDEGFVRKWQLACQGDIAHVVVMPNITELIQSRAKHAVERAMKLAEEARAASSDDE
eukprot:scaffold3.g6485.t1